MSEQEQAGGLEGVLEAVMRGAGLTDNPAEYDSDMHGWRCSDLTRFDPCDCFAEMRGDLADAVHSWLLERDQVEAMARGRWPSYDDDSPDVQEQMRRHITDGLAALTGGAR